MAGKKILIRDLTLRDGQQSLFATRMNSQQVERVLPFLKEAGFYALEVWGGAVPDSVMRYLHENPWDRLRLIRDGTGGTCLLTALSRGRNLFGYNPYPDEVIGGFTRNAIRSGISVMRVFDALNDLENLRSTVNFVRQNGELADCAIAFTIDPQYSKREKFKAMLHAKRLPNHLFSDAYFVKKAVELEAMGADMITVKDMAGLATPSRTGSLVRSLKQHLQVPVDFHTHCTPGYGLASALTAIVNGADIIDTSLMSFSGGTSNPPFELVELFCRRMGIETGVNMEAVSKLDQVLREIRHELSDFDPYPAMPRLFNFLTDTLPRDIEQLFELAIAYAKSDKEDDLLEVCRRIEGWFGLPEPDENIAHAEIPGGMYTNMLEQLRQLKLEKLLPRAMELIPLVRLASGCPPLVTPTSQIIGVQAVNCAIDESRRHPLYTTKSIQFVNLVKGVYGTTPVEVDPEFRYRVAGTREEVPYDIRYYRKQENPVFEEYGDVKLATNEEEELLLELFPAVASEFLHRRMENDYLAEIHRVEEQKRLRLEAEKQQYAGLSDEEKKARLLQGLYNYHWTTYDEGGIGYS